MTDLFATILGQDDPAHQCCHDYANCADPCVVPDAVAPTTPAPARAHLPSIAFTIPGQPVAKGRPIAGRSFGGHTTLRTPVKTVAYEGLVAHACSEAMKGSEPLSGPLALDLAIGVQIPASWSKKKQAAAVAGEVRPTKKPDLDNIVKSVCDGMNGVAYADDSQIVAMGVRKFYTQTPGVQVLLRVIEGEVA